MRMPVVLEGASIMRMTGWPGQELWHRQLGFLALLEGMALGAK